MASVTDSLETAQTVVSGTAERVRNDVGVLARWLMTYRVEISNIEHLMLRSLADTSNKDSYLLAKRAITQIEAIVHDLDMSCQAELSGALGLIDAAAEFCRERAALENHQLTDPEVRRQVLAMTDGRCTYCATAVSDAPIEGQSVKMFVEHVVPASKGGPNHLVNYVPSCGSCNSAKGDRHVLHFVRNVQPRRQEQATVVSIVRVAE